MGLISPFIKYQRHLSEKQGGRCFAPSILIFIGTIKSETAVTLSTRQYDNCDLAITCPSRSLLLHIARFFR